MIETANSLCIWDVLGGIRPNKNLDAQFGVSVELVSPSGPGSREFPVLGATGVFVHGLRPY